MNHARMIFKDAPAFIPVPANLQHRPVEAILIPLDDEDVSSFGSSTTQSKELPAQADDSKKSDLLLSDSFFALLEKIEKPRSLLELIGKGKGCFKDAAEIDAFIRAERDAWDD